MKIKEITSVLEEYAPLALQEDYDNSGLLIGDPGADVQSALLCIDVTEKVIDEAIRKNCQLIISHHPLIFKGMKSITGKNDTERCVIKAIKSDVAIYAAHTNMDNVANGVNAKIASKIGLKNTKILQSHQGGLLKLVTFVPGNHAESVRNALFNAGAGHIGNYDMCSYNSMGNGTFRALENTNPYVGEKNVLHTEPEVRIEVILPCYQKNKILSALLKNHPYEEPAFDFYKLENTVNNAGSGLVGELEQEISTDMFLKELKVLFKTPCIKHSPLCNKSIKRVALCGGSGSFLINRAITEKADIFITGDIKYHDYFLAENKLVIADIGHFESEQYTKEIFYEVIRKKFPTFVTYFSDVNSNPINYL